MKKHYVRGLIAMSFVAALFFTSCEKEKTPDYVGTWYYTETDDLFGEVQQRLILQESSIELAMEFRDEDENWQQFMGFKGNLQVDGDNFTMTITQIGSPEIDFETMTFGEIVWYGAETEEFDSFIEDSFDGTATQSGTLIVDGNTLTIKADGDTVIYTKS